MDITKCEGTNCPLKESCFRFRAIGDKLRQSYFIEVPYNHETNTCDVYWKITENETRINKLDS